MTEWLLPEELVGVGDLFDRSAELCFEVRSTPYGLYYWRLVDRDDRVLATSESFANRRTCLAAIAVVRASMQTAPVVDRSRRR